MEHSPTGKHILLDGGDVNPALLNDADRLAEILLAAAERAGATVMQVHKQQFEPQGVSVILLLAESHMTIHTYPEAGVFMADFFTCGNDCNPQKALDLVKLQLQPRKMSAKTIKRGLQ